MRCLSARALLTSGGVGSNEYIMYG